MVQNIKIKKRQRTLGWGSVPFGGSHEEAKVSAHLEISLWVGLGGGLYNLREEHNNMCSEGKMEKIHHGDHC